MSASPKVVNLHGRGRASESTLQLVEVLRTQVLNTLQERLGVMFDSADDLLFDFAERAGNNQDRRLFFDTMRAVRLNRRSIGSRFHDQLVAAFAAGPAASAESSAASEADLELSLQKDDALERDIAVQNMASKAEGLFKALLWDINARLQTLIDDLHAPIASDALAPKTFCTAFRKAAETLSIGHDVELVVFKLFDRLVISELGDLYATLHHLLKANGIRPAQPAPVPPQVRGGTGGAPASAADPGGEPRFGDAGPAAGFGPAIGSAGAGAGTGTGGALPPGLAASMMSNPGFDPLTLASLQQLGAMPTPGYGYSNASLAADLAAVALGRPVLGWSPRQSTAYLQRASLVGHMFSEFLADPHLPNPLRPKFDGLRLATMKVALKDLAFLADPGHPVRGLINELATMASTAKVGGADHMARIAELVQQIQAQFDVAAETLRRPPPDIELLAAEQAERFIEQQMAQTAARRQAIVRKVRSIIAEELQLRTRGHALPDAARPLLNSLWAPMMAMHLLHHGPDSAPWTRGIASLERVLALLDPAQPDLRANGSAATLRSELEADFRAVGLTDARIADAFAQFEAAIAERIAADAAPKPAAPAEAATNADVPTTTEPATEIGAKADAETGIDTTADVAAIVPAPIDVEPAAAGPGENSVTALLEQLIQSGSWYLVFDHDRNESRWMKAVAYYAGLDCAAFAEFNGSNTLLLKSQTLLDDLLARRTMPVDLSPSARAALDGFLARAS